MTHDKHHHHDTWKEFEGNDVTHSAAHHLLAILELREKRGYARVTDVARHLNITTGSASTNLKTLKTKGLIAEDENRFLVLTAEGESLAKAVVQRRNIIHKFLCEILRVSADQAEIDACKTEHLISAETARKLERFMKEFQLTESRAAANQ
jgi:DtxR family Mn-dependent transcriptional regulator